MYESIDMIIIVIIILIIAILIHYGFKNANGTMTNTKTNNDTAKVEHLINTDDRRKKELIKPCTEPRCYSKPLFLRENGEANKQEAEKELEKMFEQTYTQEEYYKKLNELNFIKTQDMPNVLKEQEFVNKLNERITLDKAVGETLFDKIVSDKQDEVCGYNIRGYDMKDYAPFIPVR